MADQVEGGAPSDKIDSKTLFRPELCEIHLLLDHVSGGNERSMRGPADGSAGPAPDARESEWQRASRDLETLLPKICRIEYPPTSGASQKAEDKQTLLQAKDLLNWMCAPATGFSIAYTTMFAVGPQSRRTGLRGAVRTHVFPAPDALAAGAIEHDEEQRLSRVALAESAYPGLVKHARRYRFLVTLLVFLSIFVALACMWSAFQMQFGRALIERISTIAEQQRLVQARIDAAQRAAWAGVLASRVAALPAQQKTPAGARAADGVGPLVLATTGDVARGTTCSGMDDACAPPHVRLCDRIKLRKANDSRSHAEADAAIQLRHVTTGSPPATVDRFDSIDEQALCDESNDWQVKTDRAYEDLKTYLESRSFRLICLGSVACAFTPERTVDKSGFEQLATSALTTFSTTVLPLAFGLLGTLVSFLRHLYGRIRRSLLTPMQVQMALLRLPLGLVAAVAVGLVFAPADNCAPLGLCLTDKSLLSVSALAFLAGYSVETLFAFLDRIVRTTYGGPAKGSTPPDAGSAPAARMAGPSR